MKQEKLTVEQFRALAEKQKSGYGKKKSKYHAVRVGGHASKKEHHRAAQLRMLQQAGLISDLREQVRFVLIPAQNDQNGNPIEKSCCYIADFVYTDNQTGQPFVEDTKGVRTKEYIIKRKLMLWVHGIRIKEV